MSKDKPSLGTGLDSLLGSRSDSETNPVSQISVEDLNFWSVPTQNQNAQTHPRRAFSKH